jgi:pimeloyl-ACP methyl ester carboxylesterase
VAENGARPRVLLLHGIWMRSGITARLDARLQKAGFRVQRFDYASIKSPVNEHHARLARAIDADEGPVHLVGHSLGGVIAVDFLRSAHAAARRVQRVVCLGSPLRGSQLARRLSRVKLDKLGLGGARQVLIDGLPEWQGETIIGVIAGELSFGLSLILGPLPRPNDGTVAVAETRLAGISDHCTVAASHTALLFSEHAAALTASFLRHGRFADPTPSIKPG